MGGITFHKIRYINVYKSHPAGLRRRNLYRKLHKRTIFELLYPIGQYTILAQSINTFITEMSSSDKAPPCTSLLVL